MKIDWEIIFIMSLVGLLAFLMVLVGLTQGEKLMQTEAVKNRLAHWEVADSGKTTFVWNTYLTTPKVLEDDHPKRK